MKDHQDPPMDKDQKNELRPSLEVMQRNDEKAHGEPWAAAESAGL